jgi:uncharacterized protein YdeI (YjbR/CyaY-like superfamily)
MDIGVSFKAADRAAWRALLQQNTGTAREIWLIMDDRPEENSLSYLDAVEEALCFGWIDSTQKRYSTHERAQRFSPRKSRSGWTELNKARARRLIRLGLMTAAGRAVLPDLDAPFIVAEDIAAAIQAEPGAWEHFLAFPELYRRVRIGNIESMRKNPGDFERLLNKFVEKTAANQLYGSWDDGGRLGEEPGQAR